MDAHIITHRHNHQVTEKLWMSSFFNALSTNFIFLSQIRVIGETESSSIMSYQHQTRNDTKKVMIKRLPKTTRKVIFVLGLSMVTMAWALDRAESLDQSILFSKTADCPDTKLGKVKVFIAGH